MRASQFFLSTHKEVPAEAELLSHQLMLRSGMIRKLGSGLYTWMPLGLRVLRKIEAIVRSEMNGAGAIELLMPAVQPAELWRESGRWEEFGPQMLKIQDRHQRDFCFGPTHEEVVTDIARHELRSYRQLPVNFYQIQTKFRDEIRPRFGVMRAREFLMKDAYSFDADKSGLEQSYLRMYRAYTRIFTRLGLRFRAVAADPGAIGGTGSHEFHVLADSGEDTIAYCAHSDYAANLELAEALTHEARPQPAESLAEAATPGRTTCEEVAALLGVPLRRTVKSLVLRAGQRLVMLLLRGDHTVNEVKVGKLRLPDGTPLAGWRWASESEVESALGTKPGYLGPVGIAADIALVADRSAAVMADFVCGANKPDLHLRGANFGRDDLREPDLVADVRNVVAGDPSPDGKGSLELCRGIEVGHVFQLGTKYSEAMKASFVDENGQARLMEMGCYGIGVSRIAAAAIEQNHDERGIVWPLAMAPFEVALAPVGYRKSAAVQQAADRLHDALTGAGFDVLLDDREARPGVMFAELELIGIPHRVTVGERSLSLGKVEYQGRRDPSAAAVSADDVVDLLRKRFDVHET